MENRFVVCFMYYSAPRFIFLLLVESFAVNANQNKDIGQEFVLGFKLSDVFVL